MAPVRRYLRITKYSVLECRIYLDNPSLAQSWLLNPRYNILAQVIDSIRPLVLPKLLEEKERERTKKKTTKKAKVKDVVVKDDFEVSMFLMETSTRHSLLTKKKHFREKLPARIQSNASRLMDENSSPPANLDDEAYQPIRIEDSDGETGVNLEDIPSIEDIRTSKRDRVEGDDMPRAGLDIEDAIDLDDELDAPPAKRLRSRALGSGSESEDADEDKKKLAMDVSYEGFAIYGRVLCLVVKKRQSTTSTGASSVEGQAKMENWITSTQVPVGQEES